MAFLCSVSVPLPFLLSLTSWMSPEGKISFRKEVAF
jgi:hypothetical protein